MPPQLILTNWDLGITSLDPHTGKLNWENRNVFGAREERAIGSPITGGGLVVGTRGFTARPRNLVVVDPMKAKNHTIEPLYKHTDSWVAHIPTPLILGDKLYSWCDNGIVTCLELRTGKQLFQSRVEGASGNFFSSPVSDGKHIFNVTEYGSVVVIKAGVNGYQQVAVNNLGDDVMRSTPAIANGDLYIRTHHQLYCIKGK
jgi:outer membrane protein assembly factor BamB